MAAEELGRSFLKKKERRTKKQNVSFIFIKGTLKQASMNESISFFFFLRLLSFVPLPTDVFGRL